MPQKLKKKISDGDSDLESNNDSSESTLPTLPILAGLSLLDVCRYEHLCNENEFNSFFLFPGFIANRWTQ